MPVPVLLESNPVTGGWSASCSLLPGYSAHGATREAAVLQLKDALRTRSDVTYSTPEHDSQDALLHEPPDSLQFALELLDELGIAASPGRQNHIAFGWYGGKYSHLEWLLPLLPAANHYCEPFGGSAAVLLNREISPVETYNDVDGEVVNFFRILREHRDELVNAIVLTPFSRQELTSACSEDVGGLEPLERARRFYVRARQTRTGLAQTASPGRWATCRNTSRRGMGGAVSRWLGSAPDLLWIAARLLRVQIDNRSALEVVSAYDAPDTLFYCGPPYPHESRGDSKAYAFEITDGDHRDLARLLRNAAGKVAVSGYRCPLMDELYDGWVRTDAPAKPCHSTKGVRQEALWSNYEPPAGTRSKCCASWSVQMCQGESKWPGMMR